MDNKSETSHGVVRARESYVLDAHSKLTVESETKIAFFVDVLGVDPKFRQALGVRGYSQA